MVLMVLEVILVFLGVVLVVLEVTGAPVTVTLCFVADLGKRIVAGQPQEPVCEALL